VCVLVVVWVCMCKREEEAVWLDIDRASQIVSKIFLVVADCFGSHHPTEW